MGTLVRLHRLLSRCFSASFVLKIWRGKCSDHADAVAELIGVLTITAGWPLSRGWGSIKRIVGQRINEARNEMPQWGVGEKLMRMLLPHDRKRISVEIDDQNFMGSLVSRIESYEPGKSPQELVEASLDRRNRLYRARSGEVSGRDEGL